MLLPVYKGAVRSRPSEGYERVDTDATPALSRSVRPPRLFRWVETGSIVACLGASGILGLEVLRGLAAHAPTAFALGFATVAGYLAADLISGIVHFIGDSFGTVDMPYLGSTFVLPFRSHHVDPGHICVHDFVETNGNNAFASLFLVVPVAFAAPIARSAAWTTFGLGVLVFTIAVLLTNQIHKWAHVAEPPRVVRALQRVGVFLSPEVHAAHHSPPYVGGYCVTSGFFNRVLDPIQVFPRLERAIRRTLRLERKLS